MVRAFFFVTVALCVLAAEAAPAKQITALLQVAPNERLSGSFKYEPPETEIRLFTSERKLRKFQSSTKCVGDDRRPLCDVLKTMMRSTAERCLAVLLDSNRPRVSRSVFRVGTGKDEKAAKIKAFFGSKTYDGLYFEERLANPFRKAEEIDQFLFDSEERWDEAIVAIKCI